MTGECQRMQKPIKGVCATEKALDSPGWGLLGKSGIIFVIVCVAFLAICFSDVDAGHVHLKLRKNNSILPVKNSPITLLRNSFTKKKTDALAMKDEGSAGYKDFEKFKAVLEGGDYEFTKKDTEDVMCLLTSRLVVAEKNMLEQIRRRKDKGKWHRPLMGSQKNSVQYHNDLFIENDDIAETVKVENIGKYLTCGVAVDECVFDYLESLSYRSLLEKIEDNGAYKDILVDRENPTKEVKILRGLYETNPESPMTLSRIGNYLRYGGETVRAVECYRKALSIDPEHLETHLFLARALIGLGQIRDAGEVLRRSLEIAANSYLHHLTLAQLFHAQGMLSEATTFYRNTLLLNPGYPPAVDALRDINGPTEGDKLEGDDFENNAYAGSFNAEDDESMLDSHQTDINEIVNKNFYRRVYEEERSIFLASSSYGSDVNTYSVHFANDENYGDLDYMFDDDDNGFEEGVNGEGGSDYEGGEFDSSEYSEDRLHQRGADAKDTTKITYILIGGCCIFTLLLINHLVAGGSSKSGNLSIARKKLLQNAGNSANRINTQRRRR